MIPLENWKVVLDVGNSAGEILCHFLDEVGISTRLSATQVFLGRPFRSKSEFDGLTEGKLERCTAQSVTSPVSGIGAVCREWITRWVDLVAWAGIEESDIPGKNWFWEFEGGVLRVENLVKAAQKLEHLSFFWDKRYPKLCDARIP
jgi:hypothetical protein